MGRLQDIIDEYEGIALEDIQACLLSETKPFKET